VHTHSEMTDYLGAVAIRVSQQVSLWVCVAQRLCICTVRMCCIIVLDCVHAQASDCVERNILFLTILCNVYIKKQWMPVMLCGTCLLFCLFIIVCVFVCIFLSLCKPVGVCSDT